MSHTPAPWIVCVHDDETTIEAEYQSICFGVSNCDADLIAAAPELLEALLKFQDCGALKDRAEYGEDYNAILAFARAAIAKSRSQHRSAVGIESGITQQIEDDAAGSFPIAKAKGEV